MGLKCFERASDNDVNGAPPEAARNRPTQPVAGRDPATGTRQGALLDEQAAQWPYICICIYLSIS